MYEKISKDKNEFNMELPERIVVSKDILKKKRGVPSKHEQRRLHNPAYRNTYTDSKKMEVCCAFAVCGNSRQVAEITKVPEGTIRAWKQTEWWSDIISRIHSEEDEELDTKLTKLVNKAVDHVNDRLDSGDWIYDTKRGELLRKPVSSRDLAIVAAITVDKRQLLRGQPTSRVEKVSHDERLSKLALQFKQFTEAKEVESTAQLIEEENLDETLREEEYSFEETPQEEESEQPTINDMFSE